jgi:hypothetical protein
MEIIEPSLSPCCDLPEYRCSWCHQCYNHNHDKFEGVLGTDGFSRWFYRCHSTGLVKPAFPDYYPRGFIETGLSIPQ